MWLITGGYRIPKELDIVPARDSCVHRPSAAFQTEYGRDLSMARFFDRIAHYLKPDSIVLAETGTALFAAAEVLMPQGTKFIGQTFYGSIGYTVGATLGACIAAPHRNVVLFIGDGSFQVTGQDLSTMIRYSCTPTIFLLNNDGYTIERVIVDRVYNDIQPWKYSRLPEAFGADTKTAVSVRDCHTEGELEEALQHSEKQKRLVFIELHLDRMDCNEALRRAGVAMARNNNLLDEDEEAAAREAAVGATSSPARGVTVSPTIQHPESLVPQMDE